MGMRILVLFLTRFPQPKLSAQYSVHKGRVHQDPHSELAGQKPKCFQGPGGWLSTTRLAYHGTVCIPLPYTQHRAFRTYHGSNGSKTWTVIWEPETKAYKLRETNFYSFSGRGCYMRGHSERRPSNVCH